MIGDGLLIVISGPSGTGKGTICKELLKRNAKSLELSVSVTTRKPRVGEIDGVNYFFKNEDEFCEMIKRNDFIEYAKVYDRYYGTPKKYVLDKIKKGISIILEIDTQGAQKIRETFKDCIFVFVMPPSLKELKNRIFGRGTESEQDIQKRLNCAKEEINISNIYDYILVNNSVSEAVDVLLSIIEAEKHKAKRFNFELIDFREE